MGKHSDGELDKAISMLNYADLIYARYKLGTDEDYSKYGEKIEELVKDAWELFNLDTTPHDEYYRFVCEKSAGTFGFYGFFVYENELKKRSTV